MKTQLTIPDRISLQTILPHQDSFENLCLKKNIQDKVKFQSKEIEKFKIKTSQEGNISWQAKEGTVFPYEFDEAEKKYLSGVLKKLSEEKKLHEIQVTLYKMFVCG